jgi:starvation-inducible DNA-binding protein
MSIQDTTTFLALSEKAEEPMIEVLTPVLANSIYMQALYKKYHWHVHGAEFYQYHLLFDKHANELISVIDALAERIRTLGGVAEGMPDQVEKNKTIAEPPTEELRPQTMLLNLCKTHEAFIEHLRTVIQQADTIHDEGSNDLLVSEVLRVHELQLWFIRSCLE